MPPSSLYQIDKQTKTPLYHLIELNFRHLIINGVLKPEAMIPSEFELSNLYGVSRLTVRRALDELTRQGWLSRRQGVGTFVGCPQFTQISPSNLGFSQKMRLIGRTPGSHLVSRQVIPCTDEIAKSLNLKKEAPLVEIVRVRLADGEPIMVETASLSFERFPDLERIDLENRSLYEILSTQYHIHTSHINQTLEPILMGEPYAHLLEVKPGTPAIFSEIVALTTGNDPIEYSQSITRGDKCRFYFSFHQTERSD